MTGWWEGTQLKQFISSNELECGGKCCDNKNCKLWIWRKSDKNCIFKKDDNLKWHPASNHFAAKRNNSNT